MKDLLMGEKHESIKMGLMYSKTKIMITLRNEVDSCELDGGRTGDHEEKCFMEGIGQSFQVQIFSKMIKMQLVYHLSFFIVIYGTTMNFIIL